MEYLDYFVNLFYDTLEEFFKSFSFVSGKTTLRVLYFSLAYFLVSLLGEVTGLFTFMNIKACLLAVIFLVIVNSVSNIQRKDIEKFKELLKGDMNTNEQ